MSEIHSFSEGEVTFWIEQETIHIRAIASHGDPVELTEDEAEKLAIELLDAVRKIKSMDSI